MKLPLTRALLERSPAKSRTRSVPSNVAFTLVEILIAIGILSLVLAAIYSSWTAILRASKVGLQAAAAVQRSRMAVRTIEDSLICMQSFGANLDYYGVVAESGSEGSLSYVARLPKAFPRSGKFGGLDVRRVTFSIEASQDGAKQLVLRQNPILMEWDIDEKEHPLVLAKFVNDFKIEFWDQRKAEWMDEWKQTNQMPKLVKFSLKFADNARASQREMQEITRIVNIPAVMVQPAWQMPMTPGRPGQPGQPGNPNNPQPGMPPGAGQPGIPPGGAFPPAGPGGSIR